MPDHVQRAFGSALRDAQYGEWPEGARPFGEGAPRGVMKLADDGDAGTYRAAFTVRFPECVYLLHVFQKKSVRGIATPSREIATIRGRFRDAAVHHQEHYDDA